MRNPDLWSRPEAEDLDATDNRTPRGFRAMILSEAGSVQTAVGLFGITLAVLITFGVLHLIGSLHVNTLIFLILVVAVLASALDLWREHRKSGRGNGHD